MSKTQRKQMVCLSMTFPVKTMLSDAIVPRMHRLNPILARIQKQAMGLMVDLPKCDLRSYKAMDEMINQVWNDQARNGHDAATMINAALYVAEDCLMHQRKDTLAARKKRDLWNRLCGSLFTLYKHLCPLDWQDPCHKAQVNGAAIGKAILSA